MRYLKAQNVLPNEIISIIQQFVDGEFVYIPRKFGEQRSWGEKSGTKDSLKERNAQIFGEYVNGSTVADLSQSYYLSEQSIRRIISQEKSQCSSSLHSHLWNRKTSAPMLQLIYGSLNEYCKERDWNYCQNYTEVNHYLNYHHVAEELVLYVRLQE